MQGLHYGEGALPWWVILVKKSIPVLNKHPLCSILHLFVWILPLGPIHIKLFNHSLFPLLFSFLFSSLFKVMVLILPSVKYLNDSLLSYFSRLFSPRLIPFSLHLHLYFHFSFLFHSPLLLLLFALSLMHPPSFFCYNKKGGGAGN